MILLDADDRLALYQLALAHYMILRLLTEMLWNGKCAMLLKKSFTTWTSSPLLLLWMSFETKSMRRRLVWKFLYLWFRLLYFIWQKRAEPSSILWADSLKAPSKYERVTSSFSFTNLLIVALVGHTIHRLSTSMSTFTLWLFLFAKLPLVFSRLLWASSCRREGCGCRCHWRLFRFLDFFGKICGTFNCLPSAETCTFWIQLSYSVMIVKFIFPLQFLFL